MLLPGIVLSFDASDLNVKDSSFLKNNVHIFCSHELHTADRAIEGKK